MPRRQARRQISTQRLAKQLKGVYFDRRIAKHLRDEAPSAYKDIDRVMRAQKKLVRITRRLWPILCYKGR